jgi:glycosyltransferase involved in cell wall biosynthesis
MTSSPPPSTTAHSAGTGTAIPRVSVVIPVRNGKDFIHEAIDSVLLQSFDSLELIIVDDGSDDFDYTTLRQVDPRIRTLRLEGSGVSHARNAGMQQARGEFIAFLDADDVWFPGKLCAQVRYFDNHPDVGVVFGGFIRWTADEQGVFPPAHSLWHDCSDMSEAEAARSGWIYTRLLLGLLVGMNTAVIRRRVYQSIGGFNPSMRVGEDYDFWLKAARVTQMHALAGTVAFYRIHGSSAMHRLSAVSHLATLLQTAHLRWGLTNPDGSGIAEREFRGRIGNVYFDHGYSHFWHGDLDVARHAFWRALLQSRRKPRAGVYYALTLWKRLRRRMGGTDLRR